MKIIKYILYSDYRLEVDIKIIEWWQFFRDMKNIRDGWSQWEWMDRSLYDVVSGEKLKYYIYMSLSNAENLIIFKCWFVIFLYTT